MIANRPKATMRDVAEEAGVSKALVSLVYRTPEKVSPERRAWVLEAAERLGFRPNWVASSLSARESSFTAILVSNMHNPVFGTVVDSARATLAEAGRYGLMSSAVIPGPDGVFQAGSSSSGSCRTGRCCATSTRAEGSSSHWPPSTRSHGPPRSAPTTSRACAS
jgi:hypothetical protein